MIKEKEITNPHSCLNKALDTERIFVLLARDSCAPYAIRAWVSERCRTGQNADDDLEIIEALDCADAMEVERMPVRTTLKRIKEIK